MVEILTSLYHQISESAKWIDALQDADNTKYATSKLSDEDKEALRAQLDAYSKTL